MLETFERGPALWFHALLHAPGHGPGPWPGQYPDQYPGGTQISNQAVNQDEKTMTGDDIRATLAAADLIHDEAAVDAAITRLAQEITHDLGERTPLILCVMVGGLVMAGRLLPRLGFPLEVDYLHATRYRGGLSGLELQWLARPRVPLAGRSVLVVDDILDEGHTLHGILDYCRGEGALDVRTAVLVKKVHDRCVPGVSAHYIGLTVTDRYVFGAGMDYKGYLRNAPGIYAASEKEK